MPLSAKDFLLFAHRGDNRHFTENTLEAFQSSLKAGYRAVELDLVRLRDDAVVVFHDDDLERICGVKKNIHDIDLPEFKKIFPSLLTFEELLRAFSDEDIELNLEIKDDVKTLEMIAEKAAGFKHPVISSFHPEIVDAAIARGLEGAYLFSEFSAFFRRILFLRSRRVHLSSRMILKFSLLRFLFSGYDIYCYTVNDVNDALRLKKISSVRGIFTDRIDMISELKAE